MLSMKYIANESGTILDALQNMAPEASKTRLRSWLKEGRVALEGQPVDRPGHSVAKGQKITLSARPRPSELTILHQDRHLVAIDKPNGLLSVATHYQKDKTAHALLKQMGKPGRVFPVHRLDRETSGVMIFALTEEGRDGLKSLFENHDIIRRYEALVEGRLDKKRGLWKSYLHEDRNYLVHSGADPERGKLAVTHYEVLETNNGISRLRLTLETGRKNQIRVHCQEAGHPVLGDKKYGPGRIPCKRLCLHATLLELKHPITGKRLALRSPTPF